MSNVTSDSDRIGAGPGEERVDVGDALDARDRALASACHDLRNPLNVIALATQRLDLEATAGWVRRDVVTDHTRLIATQVRKMSRLLEDLIDVACLDLGRHATLDRGAVDLVELAHTAADERMRSDPRAAIRIRHDDDRLLGRWDGARLGRVVDNLLSNAIKYSPGGASVDVVVRADRDGDGARWAVLTVTDRGLGIPADDLPHVFERFRRARNVVGVIAGTGIGLSSARYLVEQHGGTIELTSREGEGTTVTVRLPL